MITIIDNFISPSEEQEILKNIKPGPKLDVHGRNRIIRYGSQLPYVSLMKSKELPDWINFVIDRIMEKGLLSERPDHMTINEYLKGQSIDWHIDSVSSGPVITILSLKGKGTMGVKDKKGQEVQYLLPARSLLQITEKERWEDKHAIYPVPEMRYSLVFRKGTK